MLVSVNSISSIVKDFIQTAVIPKAPGPLMQFGLGFMTPYIPMTVDQQLTKYLPTLKMIGLVNENGHIDLEKAKMSAINALDQVSGKLNVFGYMIDRTDIESLYSIAQRYQVTEPTNVQPIVDQPHEIVKS